MRVSNVAGAKVLHQYAAGANPQTTWLAGGLLESRSLGRGGAMTYGYSNDGAKDFVEFAWPAVESAGFANEGFYDNSVGITHRNEAGNITAMADPAGQRSLFYQKNRLTETDWFSGELSPYKVVREYDANGRALQVTLHRNGAPLHGVALGYTGASGEVSGVTTAGFVAGISRDATSRHVTGFTRGAVTQAWSRGTAGRITAANTAGTVNGAPTFSYSTFDTKGRRLSVTTNKGNWTYGYRNGANGDGQLASAESTGNDLGDFPYNFDGIGRRANFAGNVANALNQFVAIEHPLAPKNLYISADPDARLCVNGTEMTPFSGGWIYPLGHPGAAGGWVPWTAKGVLEDAGDTGAFPDAVAEFSGNVFFPPTSETFTFDADGNRESSALWNYGWDGRNKLVRARTKTWNTAPQGWDVKFDYDAEGRRFRKEVTRYHNGNIAEQKVIHFVWDGWDLLYERHQDIHGNFLMDRKYVWGPDIADGAAGGAGGLLLIRETRGTTTNDYYPLFDGTGHVTSLADNTGKLVAEYWWGPFGELIAAKGEMAKANPFRFATKYFDAETGLYYFGHRYYDPTTGQWMNREPLGEEESLNLYSYCHNDPVNNVDVLGLREMRVVDPNEATRFKLIDGIWHVNIQDVERTRGWSGFNNEVIGQRYEPIEQHHRIDGLLYHYDVPRDGRAPTLQSESQFWVDASRIAEERYHLSTHAKIGTWAMGSYSVALAAPVACAYSGGSLLTAGYVKLTELSVAGAAKLSAGGAVLQQAYQRAAPFLTRVSYSPTLHGLASDGTFNPGLRPGALGSWFQRGSVLNPLYKVVPAGSSLPQGLSVAQFDKIAGLLRGGANHISDDIVVQGSRASGAAHAASDIDFAVRVSPEKFIQLITDRFGAAKFGTAKGRTMLHALETGKIQAGEAGLGSLRRELQKYLGMDVDLSIIKIGGAFDNGVTLPVP